MLRRPPIVNNLSLFLMNVAASVSILGILVGLAIKSYVVTIGHVSVASIAANVGPLVSEIYTFYALNNYWPTEQDELRLFFDDEYQSGEKGEYILDNGSLHVVINSNYQALNGKIISFRKAIFPGQPDATTMWLCGYQAIPAGMTVDTENRTNVEKKYMTKGCK